MGFARYEMKHNSMFSQRHYVAIAKMINNIYRRYSELEMEWALEPLDDVTRQLNDLFRVDNPNFKPDKFDTAVWEGIKK